MWGRSKTQKVVHVHSGFPGDVSEEQEAQLTAFKEFLMATGVNMDLWPDYHCLRFLRARKFDQAATQLMVNNYITWRKNEQVDDIETNFTFSEYNEVQKHYPHGYFKADKQGRPIYIERIGMLNVGELFKITTEERMIRHYIQEYERLMCHKFPACTAAANSKYPITQGLTIMDLTGGGVSTFTSQVRELCKLAAKVGSDYYPEIMGNLFVVNAPMLFSGIWAVIKGFLDERTRNKIKILGGSYLKTLLEYVDEENLPDFIGGKCTAEQYGGNCLTSNCGPWNDYEPCEPYGVGVRLKGQAVVEEVKENEEQKENQLNGQSQSQNQNNQEEIKDNTA